MKKIILVLSIIFVFMSGCQILNSDKTASPEISIEPSPILVGQEIEVEIKSSTEFIMPYCGGINYEIEKLEAGNWHVFDGEYGPCDTMMKPERSISKSTSINLTIEEDGVYRFVSSFKFNPDDDMEPLYSDKFEVKSEE